MVGASHLPDQAVGASLALAPPRPLPSQRHLFDVPDDVCYLNCATMAPSLRAVTEAGKAALEDKARPWRIGAHNFFENTEEARGLVAEILGADADGVAIVPSVSYGLATVTANVRLDQGQTVVVLAEEFPSSHFAWKTATERAGAKLVVVDRPGDGDWTTAVSAAVDERTAVVSVPNCHWTNGGLVDLVRVGEAARAAGALLVVDASQSLGAAPLDVAQVQPDAVVSAAYKWLLGPYSLAYLWLAPHLRDGTPLEQTWMSRKGSDDFARLVDYRDDYQPGARRYDMGEVANFVHLPMSIAALRQILAWGVPTIAATLRKLTNAIAAEAAALGLTATPADHRISHLIGLGLPPGASTDLPERLADAGVHVSVRGPSIRVAPHVYNDGRDIKRLTEVLASVV